MKLKINVPPIQGKLSTKELDKRLAFNTETMRKCPVHPRYRGRQRPKVDCAGCWRYYLDGDRWRDR